MVLFTGVSESMDDETHIEVPEDDFGLYSCDLLDPDFVRLAAAADVTSFGSWLSSFPLYSHIAGCYACGYHLLLPHAYCSAAQMGFQGRRELVRIWI